MKQLKKESIFLKYFLIRHRFAVFCDNVDEIEEINSKPGTTWTAGINKFADLTPEDMKRLGYIGGLLPKEDMPGMV